ncbi:MAG TPA: citrate lyase subunit alpha [Thermotogota bacterium]|nr:citrate lyase subunit alpha [Thermotogota bacterium]
MKVDAAFPDKVVRSLEDAVERIGLGDGMTVSFHHHLREGDRVLLAVLEAVRKKGIRSLTLCASSLMRCHDGLIDFLRDGTVIRVDSSGLRGRLGQFVRQGGMKQPVILRSHGGRARAVADGERAIDIAFIAASASDIYGNANGVQGDNAFGSLGYGIWDSFQAKKTVIVTDHLSQSLLPYISISQSHTDCIAVVDSIGNRGLLKAGALAEKSDPLSTVIAKNVATLLLATGIARNGSSIQMGSGGVSLKVIRYLKEAFLERGWRFRHAVGGITGGLLNALEEGWIEALMDVQSFDPAAAVSILRNRNHHEIDVNTYANPDNPSNMVNDLDIAILSALEIDLDWNINVLTGSDGVLMGAIGGHPDVAEASKLTIVVAPLIRERIPIVVDRVRTVVTPGKDIDIFVCDWGIAVKEEREDIRRSLTEKGIRFHTMKELFEKATRLVGQVKKEETGGRPVAWVQDRRGRVLSEIYESETSGGEHR